MKTYCSTCIKKADMTKGLSGDELKRAEQGIAQLEQDIRTFSSKVRKMTNDLGKPRSDKSESIHVEYKREYGLSDYFVTSLTSAAKGINSSAKECLERNIDTNNRKISQMEQKIESLQGQIKNAEKIKLSLIARSKAEKAGQPLPPIANYFNSGIEFSPNADGSTRFEISRGRSSRKKKSRPTLVFENEYLFETQYLDPYIRDRKRKIRQIQGRIHNTKRRIEKLERDLKNEKYHISFGGKKLFRQRHKDGLNLPQWKASFKRKRLREMLLVGRKDASQGNFLVRYDTKEHTLTYLSTKKTKIVLPGVIFPYGQENVNMAVNASETAKKNKKLPPEQQLPCWDKIPVTWSIKDCGNAFLVKCTIEIPENKNMNTEFSNGCVGVDKNYDHFAVSEINRYGQLVKSFVVPFKMAHCSSNQVTYNGPQKSDQWVKKDREHGKIKESKKRRKKPWDEHSTVRSSRRNWC